MQKVNAAAGENKTLDVPLVYQPIHVRGGYILCRCRRQATRSTLRQRTLFWSLLVTLDKNGQAKGEFYLDDGIGLGPNATKNVEFSFTNNTLHATVSGDYNDALPLANITIAGISSRPHRVSVNSGACLIGAHCFYEGGSAVASHIEQSPNLGCSGYCRDELRLLDENNKYFAHSFSRQHHQYHDMLSACKSLKRAALTSANSLRASKRGKGADTRAQNQTTLITPAPNTPTSNTADTTPNASQSTQGHAGGRSNAYSKERTDKR
ncbi:hypothetical protein LTR22_027320 [Elasticomyces elasticus]|nr:hypothetical protein LTR22_027320 [Elasticomyces elasticus]